MSIVVASVGMVIEVLVAGEVTFASTPSWSCGTLPAGSESGQMGLELVKP